MGKSHFSGTSKVGTKIKQAIRGAEEERLTTPKRLISDNLLENICLLEEIFAGSDDLRFNHWSYGPDLQHKACSVYYESLVQGEMISYMKHSLQDLVTHEVGPGTMVTPEDFISFFERHGVSEKKASVLDDFDEAVKEITSGNTVIFINQWNKALNYQSLSVETRQVSEPVNESVIQGPRESCVEDLQKNIALLRLRLNTPKFKIASITAGGETRTNLSKVL
jgi:spore germination protein KA/spore germination protein